MKRRYVAVVAVVALAAIFGWRLRMKHADAAGEATSQTGGARVSEVSVAPATVRDVVETFDAVGTVESLFNVRIAPNVAGCIDFLQAREGDHVTPGQVLVRIDPKEVEAQVRQQSALLAEAQFRLGQAVINRVPNDAGVATQVRQQEQQVVSARANLREVLDNSEAKKAFMRAAVNDAQGRIEDAQAAMARGESAIRSSQSNLANARAKHDRIRSLYQDGYIAAQDVDDAKAAMDVEQANLDTARQQLATARAQRDSMTAQKAAAERQYEIGLNLVVANRAAARAQLEQAQAALDYARANTAQKPAYVQNLEALRSSVTAAEASVRNAQANRAYTVLRSSIAGVVTARYMDPGMTATPGQPILALQALDQVWVTFPVIEAVSRKISRGKEATVSLDALPGRTFRGKVVQINPAADPTGRQFIVRVALDNTGHLFRPGMYAHVQVETTRAHNAVVVPLAAVQRGEASTSVVVVDAANVARHVSVTTGPADSQGISITSGLEPDAKVVTTSVAPLHDGSVVKIAENKRKAH